MMHMSDLGFFMMHMSDLGFFMHRVENPLSMVKFFGTCRDMGPSQAKKMKVRIFENQEHWSVFQGTGSSNMHFLAFSISGPPRSDGQLARVL
jgi:hypothetical protein